MTKIKIGTRSSKLAMWQAEYIAQLLKAGGMEVELVPMETKGDKILDRQLSKIGSKGVFTEELEAGLRDGSLDIAVHSAKDMPSSLEEGLELIAFTERETANDVLVSFHKDCSLSKDMIVGTSSTRRVALLKYYYPQLTITDMRGNLQTRFQKMKDGQCDAMILAYAGVHRMGMHDYIVEQLPLNTFTPPTGQGCVTIEACPERLGQQTIERIRACCNNQDAELALSAERAYLKTMNGGCSIPTFCHARLEGEELLVDAGIIDLEGKQLVKKTKTSVVGEAVATGDKLAKEVLESGGAAILEKIKMNL